MNHSSNIQICTLITISLLVGFIFKSLPVVIFQFTIFTAAIFHYYFKIRLSSSVIVADAVAKQGSLVHVLMQRRWISFVIGLIFSMGIGFHLVLWVYTCPKVVYLFILFDILALYFIDKVTSKIFESQLVNGSQVVFKELWILSCNTIVLIIVFVTVDILMPSPVSSLKMFDPSIADVASSNFSHNSLIFQRVIRTMLFINYNIDSLQNAQNEQLKYLYYISKVFTLPIMPALGVSILIRSSMQLPYKIKLIKDQK